MSSCDDTTDLGNSISGTVTDVNTDQPIAGVVISLLEGGPETVSDQNGTFSFSESEVATVEQVLINNTTTIPIAINHDGYRSRETNVKLGESVSLKLNAKEIPAFYYNSPVQLNDDIQSGDLNDGSLDTQLIQNLMDNVYQNKYKELHSVLVYRMDRLILEEYFEGNNDTINFEGGVIVDGRPDSIQWSRNKRHYVASANKALTSIITGIAMDQAKVSFSDPISPYLPKYAAHFGDKGKASITFEDCLTMSANLKWDEWGNSDLQDMWKVDDFATFALGREYLGANTEWRYNSAIPNILLKCVDNMVGQDVKSWADDQFYKKLGITDYDWQHQPDGFPEGSARMYLRPRDMLKIGITLLNDGVWQGEQVVPSQYVQACFEKRVQTPASGTYSYMFWQRKLNGVDYLSAEGDGGNFINIIPSLNMVIVVTQGLYLKWPSYVIQMNEMMGDYILPAAQ
jgi:hypothetical protein